MQQLEKKFLQFFEGHLKGNGPILLALSGGPDSMALFHLLLRHQCSFSVAHVDHGWREESGREAELLCQICSEKKVSFYLKKLEKEKENNNLEDRERKARLLFFYQLCQEKQFCGVLLAHHADDQAETVLKRVLEGASLPRLQGLSPRAVVEGVVLLRPLFEVTKAEIALFLEENKISFFKDSTNTDPRFLRSRLRQTVLPYLADQFGKEVHTSLCRLGRQASELGSFLDELVDPYRVDSSKIDFGSSPPKNTFLWKAIVRDFLKRHNITPSHHSLEMIIFLLKSRKAHKTMVLGKSRIVVDRGKLSLL